MTQVKICGITAPETLHAAAEAGADWVGFVFFPPSPRALTPAAAAALSATLPGGPARVGLFVDPTDAEIAATLAEVDLAVLQVHAAPDRVAALGARFRRPVWQSVGIHTEADLPHQAAGLDGLLLDAKPPEGAPLPGGNARTFDWTVLQAWHPPVPWLLAGGLTPANVAEAIRISGTPAVDVSSGVESVRGVKDAALIRAFITAAKAA